MVLELLEHQQRSWSSYYVWDTTVDSAMSVMTSMAGSLAAWMRSMTQTRSRRHTAKRENRGDVGDTSLELDESNHPGEKKGWSEMTLVKAERSSPTSSLTPEAPEAGALGHGSE